MAHAAKLGAERLESRGALDMDRLRLLGSSWMPPFAQVTSVSAVPFTKQGLILAVRLRDRGLDLPGGHAKKGETDPLQTLEREVMEEASIHLERPQLSQVIESRHHGDRPEDLSYMLSYAALIGQLLPFGENQESWGRAVVSPEGFLAEYRGEQLLMQGIIASALQLFRAGL